MKSFDSEFKKYSEKVQLKMSERRELRDRVLSYMEYHPLPKNKFSTTEAIPSESFIMYRISAKMFRRVSAFAVFIILFVPFVAERAMPGDALYIIKTNFNEPIQGRLANSPYEKIEYETKLMERRIAEARVLETQGRLTEDVRSQLARTIKGHSDAVQNSIEVLRGQDIEGAAIAQIAYSSTLDVHSAMLTRSDVGVAMSATSDAESTPVDPILSAVNEARESAAQGGRDGITPSYGGLMARIELETTRAYELFETVKKSAAESDVLDIERRLSDINRQITEAQEKRNADENLAATDLVQILKQTQKLVFFMTSIDVRASVTLESIVPVVLSKEERLERAREELRVIENTQREINQNIDLVKDTNVLEKVSEGITSMNEFITRATRALEISEVDIAETVLLEARVISNDILRIISRYKVEEVPSVSEIILEETSGTSTQTE